jgi:hypothetical protein
VLASTSLVDERACRDAVQTVLVVSTGSREYAIDSRHILEKGGALTSGASIEVSALGGSDPAERS